MTYEEISIKYPIGKLLAREKVSTQRVGHWCGQADKDFYLNNYKNVKFEEYSCLDGGHVTYVEEKIIEYRVEGWLATEEGFFVATNDWDGWSPLDSEELAEIEAKGITPKVTDF